MSSSMMARALATESSRLARAKISYIRSNAGPDSGPYARLARTQPTKKVPAQQVLLSSLVPCHLSLESGRRCVDIPASLQVR